VIVAIDTSDSKLKNHYLIQIIFVKLDSGTQYKTKREESPQYREYFFRALYLLKCVRIKKDLVYCLVERMIWMFILRACDRVVKVD